MYLIMIVKDSMSESEIRKMFFSFFVRTTNISSFLLDLQLRDINECLCVSGYSDINPCSLKTTDYPCETVYLCAREQSTTVPFICLRTLEYIRNLKDILSVLQF